MTAPLTCRNEHRRQLIRERSLNGIDYVDVHGTHLCVHFLTGIPEEFLPKKKGEPLAPQQKREALQRIVIRGGRRVTGIKAIDFAPDEPGSRFEQSCLGIEVDKEGDWSTYTVCFVELKDGRATDEPMQSLDPRYACIEFTFKIDCPAEIDCKAADECPEDDRVLPSINYLAKDYASFRQLILDRLSLVMPQWRERHVPDAGIAIVELLAYVGDYLSYQQDAVGTEQYLETARRRISVRRHARLVDYAMHEGCNARAFLEMRVRQDVSLDPRTLYFVTRPPLSDPAVLLREFELANQRGGWLPFEPLSVATWIELRAAHNTIRIYTWGDQECCLPKGATRATLLDETEERDEYDPDRCRQHEPPPPPPPKKKYSKKTQKELSYDEYESAPPPPPRPLRLKAGDFLLFEELACAGTTFNSQKPGDGGFDGVTPQPDVDKTHRHVVRLTRVSEGCDALRGNRVLEVEWSREDALPFPLCVSAIGTAPQCDYVRDLAVARGNIVLVDHGLTIPDEALDPVPPQPFAEVCEGEDDLSEIPLVAGRYRPVLSKAPLTFSEPLAPGASASSLLRQEPRAALPAITAASIPPAAGRTHSLFTPDDLADVRVVAEDLLEPKTEERKALRRRLRKSVLDLLDAGTVDEPLVEALAANLRALMENWTPHADLLGSTSDDTHFVAEIDDDGRVHLRFGDGDAGRAVDAGMTFLATYRAGNGRAGLVGPESIVHVVFRNDFNDAIIAVRNPLPSTGAVDPESVAEVKMLAPSAFRRRPERAVTADDYATLAQYQRHPRRNPRVQSAAGELRWTGSWYEASVAVDAFGTNELDPSLQKEITGSLHRVRRMGHDLRVGAAAVIPLRVELDLCVKPSYLRAHVLTAVREALGGRGLFHPDRLTLGDDVYVSRIIAAVMAVDGIAEVHVVRLEQLDDDLRKNANPDLPKGLLRLGAREIARVDNDPAAPENGLLTFRRVRGGR